MKYLIILILLYVGACWSIPKPMESVTNYNVMMVHGAYGSDKGIQNCSDSLPVEAALETGYLSTSKDAANIGYYDDRGRLTNWLDSLIFEDYAYDANGDPYIDEEHLKSSPYVYSWRAFVNPANSSINNAHELGDRKWHGCGHRRALVEEVQEKRVDGQMNLVEARKDPNFYRQIPSRYILVGHSMGGVVSREWIQNSDYYYGDVDKVITLDSPHEGTGALSCSPVILEAERWGSIIFIPYICAGIAFNFCFYTCSRSFK